MNILILVLLVAAAVIAIYSAVKGAATILWISVILLCIVVAMQSAGLGSVRLG